MLEQPDTGLGYWLELLAQGSLAALVGLAGALLVFTLTRRGEAKDSRLEADAVDNRARLARVSESIAAVVSAGYAAVRVIREPGTSAEDKRAAAEPYRESLTLFVVREIGDHPHVAGWVSLQGQRFAGYKGDTLKDGSKASKHIAQMIAALSRWRAQGAEDAAFEKKTPDVEDYVLKVLGLYQEPPAAEPLSGG
ncbi:hypothetical protein [Aeromicrobium fastidiosum]|uniref:DUF4760 domain-containing protein n=1 Tax=Aeromicrobium fastidiosum TaxID=52699 RepID=A0A641AN71_9ACTN|nr:hypothetical protein [Aeromicrobium fastidiosum]KAA1376374.1 hypothetical protein ESP62_013145 [Aeromicrobium fastidiosum]MBP2391721.1 hypothetical protein [Aeromicrobium fastidiosum]